MSEPTITYNGVSSEALGLIVTRLPDFHRAQRRVTQTDIPGRSVPIVMDEGGYDTYQTEIGINCNGVPLSTVYGWLRGEGWMVSSDEPGMKAYVYCYGQIADDRFRVGAGCYDTLTLTLTVEPYLRELNEAAIELPPIVNIDGKGHDNALPEITVTGSGDITLMVNGSSVLIDDLDGDITIDSDAGVAYTVENGEKVWAGEKIVLLDGWPYLEPAGHGNEVNWSGDVTSVVIQPHWRYL